MGVAEGCLSSSEASGKVVEGCWAGPAEGGSGVGRGCFVGSMGPGPVVVGKEGTGIVVWGETAGSRPQGFAVELGGFSSPVGRSPKWTKGGLS